MKFIYTKPIRHKYQGVECLSTLRKKRIKKVRCLFALNVKTYIFYGICAILLTIMVYDGKISQVLLLFIRASRAICVRIRIWGLMDTLSILMYILGVIVDCAKAAMVIVAILSCVALIKYLSLKGLGLLPSVEATAFVLSMVSADIAAAVGFGVFLWLRCLSALSILSGGFTYLFVLFAIVLCCAIAMRFAPVKLKSIGLFKCNRNTRKISTAACNLSNSYLAITPVLLS